MELFEQKNLNSTILTPNRRLSATLLKKHHIYQMENQQTSWQTLDCLPLQSWIDRLWKLYNAKEINTSYFLLSPQQEALIWESILKQFPTNESLLQLNATAEYAKSAWSVLKQWRVDFNHPLMQMTDDSRAFQEWASQFHLLSQENYWLDSQSIMERVIELIQQNKISLPKKLIITGFTEYTPLQEYLFETCKNQGVAIQFYHHQISPRKEGFITLPDEETEIFTMARFAKKQLTEHPTASIGCVIPHLENIRDRVIQIFSTVFCEKNTYSLEHNHLPFNISAGKSLTHYPIIHAAFDCLSFQKEKISLEEFSRFLRSPFIGNAEQEYLQRAQFDSRLRHANKTSFSFLQLLDHDSPIHIGKYCPLLKKRLHVLTHYVENLTSLLPTNEWVTHFMTILDILGWPGERSLNSHEYQIVQRWLNVLVEYRSFDNIFPPLSFKDTIQALNRLATKTIFQPQSHEAPIQILGMLEAAELPFDYTWVMGLDDTRWPPAAKPNPFITQRLQKTLHMPHATAERELTYSKALTEQLKNSAKHIIFSHAGQSGEGELRPSFLISHLPQIQLETLELDECISPAERIYQSRKLETIQDEKAPSISQNEKINGGISIFKQQAACPFKAFAEIRLNARPLESPTLGLNPAERGTLTHKALELLWRQLENSTQLAKLDEFDLKNLLDQTVTEAMQFIIDEAPTARYFSLEKERLKTLLWDWVQLEKARPPFKVISKEEETTLTISNMMITVRVDRIDELEDGSHLIIDYKTGKNHHIKYWFSDRPDEPQLPLYCMTNPKNTIGIAFATIHPNNMELLGVSKKDLSLQNIKLIADIQYAAHPDWEQQILSWQTTLEKIGTAFYQGDARVDPKENDQTCRYCELQSLCRIHEEDEYDSHS